LTFKDSYMIVFYILCQAQFKVLTLTLIDSEVFTYVFMNKFFTQQHHFLLHQLTHSCRLQEFNDQVTLIDDIIHVVEITMILNKHIIIIIIIIIIINSYILVTSVRSTHERLYAICIKWTKLSEIENHSQSTRLLHAVETVSFETMYQICSRWLHVRERVF